MEARISGYENDWKITPPIVELWVIPLQVSPDLLTGKVVSTFKRKHSDTVAVKEVQFIMQAGDHTFYWQPLEVFRATRGYRMIGQHLTHGQMYDGIINRYSMNFRSGNTTTTDNYPPLFLLSIDANILESLSFSARLGM